MLDLLETKIDSTFLDAQFDLCNFNLWRKERNAHRCGVAVYLRSEITGERKVFFEFDSLETVVIEILLDKNLFPNIYKPPSTKDCLF